MPNVPTLSRFQSWLQRVPLLRSPFALLGIGVFVIFVIFLIQLFTGAAGGPDTTPPQLQSPTQNQGGIVLTLPQNWPEYPEKMGNYRLQSSTPLELGAQALADKFGLTRQPTDFNTVYTSANQEQTLIVIPGNQGIDYTNLQFVPQPNTRVNRELALNKVKEFLTDLGFNEQQYQLSVLYLEVDPAHQNEFEATTDDTNANGIQVTVSQTLEQYPLYWEAGNVSSFSFLATDLGVSKAIFSNFPTQFATGLTRDTYSQTEIQANVQAGNYTVIGTVAFGAASGRLTQLDASSAQVEYRISSAQEGIAPYLLLTGTGIYSDGQRLPTQITTPLTR